MLLFVHGFKEGFNDLNLDILAIIKFPDRLGPFGRNSVHCIAKLRIVNLVLSLACSYIDQIIFNLTVFQKTCFSKDKSTDHP